LRAAAQLKTAARELALLADLSMRALRTDDLKTLLDDAVGLVADMLGVDLSSIAEVEPGGQGLGWRSAFGWSREEIIHAPPSPAGPGSLVGYTMAVGQPVVSEDVRADKRFDISAVFAERAPVSAAAVVIPGPHTPFGVLVVAARTRRSFETEEIKFMQAVANVIGNAYEHAEEGKRVEAARETERSRIARELHDDGLRELTEALGAATIGRSTATGRQDKQRWSSVTVALQRLGRQLRGAIYDLRLGTDDERAFADLLTELVAVQADLAANCQIQLDGQERLPAGSLGHRGVEVLRILREAVTNARRHSGATTIRVSGGASTPGFLRLEVSDDGEWPARGAEVAERRSPGLGSMFERAAEAGAVLRIGQGPAGGTIVSLELPLRSESGSGPDARGR
jgi:signal transduction histidine kinase